MVVWFPRQPGCTAEARHIFCANLTGSTAYPVAPSELVVAGLQINAAGNNTSQHTCRRPQRQPDQAYKTGPLDALAVDLAVWVRRTGVVLQAAELAHSRPGPVVLLLVYYYRCTMYSTYCTFFVLAFLFASLYAERFISTPSPLGAPLVCAQAPYWMRRRVCILYGAVPTHPVFMPCLQRRKSRNISQEQKFPKHWFRIKQISFLAGVPHLPFIVRVCCVCIACKYGPGRRPGKKQNGKSELETCVKRKIRHTASK